MRLKWDSRKIKVFSWFYYFRKRDEGIFWWGRALRRGIEAVRGRGIFPKGPVTLPLEKGTVHKISTAPAIRWSILHLARNQLESRCPSLFWQSVWQKVCRDLQRIIVLSLKTQSWKMRCMCDQSSKWRPWYFRSKWSVNFFFDFLLMHTIFAN